MPIKDKNPNEVIIQKARTYIQNDFKIKLLSKRNAPIKEELKALVDKKGYVTPKGSKHLELSEELELVNTVRNSVELVPEAISIIEKHLPHLKLIETVKVVREDRLQQYIESGEISTRLAKRLYQIKESFSFSVKEK